MEQVRSFVAIELPAAVKQALRRLQDGLKAGGPSAARWVNPDSIHLTLKFLGDVGKDRLEEVGRAVAAAAAGTSPFRLEVGNPGAFPDLKRVNVVWVGVAGEMDRLRQLQQRLEAALAPLGFTPETRPFSPHLTLARLNDRATPAEKQALGQRLAGARLEAPCHFTVEAVHLMRSRLAPGGAVHTRVLSVALE